MAEPPTTSRERISAGILVFRRAPTGLEVLLGHPGGPYFARKDHGHWSIPKGELERRDTAGLGPGETPADVVLIAVALRELEEETGLRLQAPELLSLGVIRQKGGKLVHAWAVEGDLDPTMARSNTFRIEWPPRSGRTAEFPEIDRVAWFAPDEARARIKSTQIPFVDRLEAAVAGDDGGRLAGDQL